MGARVVSMIRSPEPDMAHRLWSGAMSSSLREWLAESSYDVLQIEGIELARYARAVNPEASIRIVFDDHNVEYLLQQRAFEFDRRRPGHLHGAVYSAIQTQRLRRFEQEICETAAAVLAVSTEDAERLRAIARCQPVVIPNAIDLADYPFQAHKESDGHTLLFPGTMDFRPNADAAMWFVERVLPRLTTKLPEVQCYFAGRRPQLELIRHGQRDSRIAVTGDVPSMAIYWARATLCILPLQVGGGSRFKALEAMALGVPIVSTGLGMEGINAIEGRDYLRADDPASFAESIHQLLLDQALQASLASSGRKIVERGYTQEIVNQRLTQVYQKLGA